MIKHRLVFLFPGFEPMLGAVHRDRFVRSASRSAPFFKSDVKFEQADDGGNDPQRAAPAGHPFVALNAVLSGPKGQTRTEIVICDWGDLILAYGERSPVTRFCQGFLALGDFLVTGTFFRYCRVSWRYALFFAFPIMVLLAAALAGGAVGWAARLVVGPWVSVLLGAAAAGGIVASACRRLHLLTALDDWALARDFCRSKNRDIAERITAQAEMIATRAASSNADEIVVAAHSLGASLAVLALSEALATEWRPDDRLNVVTVGSSLLKTALHPAAKDHRRAVADIVETHRIAWTDCQALSDIINFYKSNPARSLKIDTGRTPIVVRVHFRRLVTTETYRRVRRDFFRLHRQFVLAVERRAPYSFHMLLLGPNPLSRFAATKTLNPSPETDGMDEPIRAAPER